MSDLEHAKGPLVYAAMKAMTCKSLQKQNENAGFFEDFLGPEAVHSPIAYRQTYDAILGSWRGGRATVNPRISANKIWKEFSFYESLLIIHYQSVGYILK